ncbi:hypothetical protein ABT234_24190 [Streptomyces sp. NPDC001586]|uniref:hypothetical protein n=1 Tax=Streptomyces sp. NPDC001586 TaxID=3154387 RepID=UPI00332EBBF0
MSDDGVLFILIVIAIVVFSCWDEILTWLADRDAGSNGQKREKPAPVVLSAEQQILLAQIYAASADFARRAKAKGIAPHELHFPIGEGPVPVWHLFEDGWPSIGDNGIPYHYDLDESGTVRLRSPAEVWKGFDEGVGKYQKVLNRTLARKGVRPQPRQKKPSGTLQPKPRRGGRRRPPPRSDDLPSLYTRDPF